MTARFALNSPGMKRFAWLWMIVCLFFAAACSGPGGELRGATPVGYIRPVANPLTDAEAKPVTIAELSESPEDFDGTLLEVSGIYYKRPVVICSTRFQLSPARWALSDGEVRIPAAGLDDRLEELPSGRIEMTVFGRILHWQGPVGCGRQAQVTEVWYLEVLEIVSPNPITIAAVGPDDGSISIESVPAETSGGYPGPGEGDDPQVSATEIVSGTAVSEVPQPAGTPVLAPPSPTPSTGSGTPSAGSGTGSGTIPTATTTAPGNTTPTPTPTLGAATATPTTASGSPAPSATSGGGNGQPVTVDQIELLHRSIETGELQTNEIHRWPVVITSTAVITVNVASQLGLDVGIAIRDPSGNIIAQQDESHDSAPEVMTAISLTELGTYDILVTNENNQAGFYAILFLDALNEEYYTFVFNGTIEIGQSRTTDIHAYNDHFWHFFGTAGETVTIQVTPSDNSNFFLYLYGADATVLINFHDETGDGEVEEIPSFILPETGFYSILVGEYSYSASNYTISLING